MPGGWSLSPGGANANDQGTLTATTRGTLVTASASANTKGAFAQLVASTPSDSCWILVNLGLGSAAQKYSVDIAVGGAGSEVVIIPDLLFDNLSSGIADYTSILLPISIPAGTRISARAQCSNSGSRTIDVQIILFDGNFDDTFGSQVDTQGFNAAATLGTAIVPGIANTKGAWSIIGTPLSDYRGMFFAFDLQGSNNSERWLVDIGVSINPNDNVIIPNILLQVTSGVIYPSRISPFFPVSFASGSSIVARCQTNSVGQNLGITSYGILG